MSNVLIFFKKNQFLISVNGKVIWKQKVHKINHPRFSSNTFFFLYTLFWAERFGLTPKLESKINKK